MLHQDEKADKRAMDLEADAAATQQRYAAAAIDGQGEILTCLIAVRVSAHCMALRAAFNAQTVGVKRTAARLGCGRESSC